MDNLDQLVIKPAQPEDLSAINDLMAAYDMVGVFTVEHCTVAKMGDKLLGFARIEYVEDKPYLRPIVVSAQSQGQGVGKALLQHLLNQLSGLKVIARGSAAGFYTKLGFIFSEWTVINPFFSSECVFCPDLKTCMPVPMQYTLKA